MAGNFDEMLSDLETVAQAFSSKPANAAEPAKPTVTSDVVAPPVVSLTLPRAPAVEIRATVTTSPRPQHPETEEAKSSEVQACTVCSKSISGSYMRFEDKVYHCECLTCSKCRKTLTQFRRLKNGDFACEECFRVENPHRICAMCNKQISGNAMLVMGQPRHADCFKCDYCQKLISTDFCENEGKVYCPSAVGPCFKLAMGQVCDCCGKPLSQSALNVLGKRYHKECFCCAGCSTPFASLQFYSINEKPYCEACAGKM